MSFSMVFVLTDCSQLQRTADRNQDSEPSDNITFKASDQHLDHFQKLRETPVRLHDFFRCIRFTK
jgi:hypothetical protein